MLLARGYWAAKVPGEAAQRLAVTSASCACAPTHITCCLLPLSLTQIVPFLYGPRPALLRLGSGIPYREITAAVRRDAKLAAFLLLAIALFITAKIFRLF